MRKLIFKSVYILKWGTIGLVLIGLSVYFILHSSLADLQGQKVMALLDQSVTIERDKQGIPTIRAKSRSDTAFALGYVHAQERFFQMDLLRRSAAGELAQLFGDGALESDRNVKLHRFRERAQKLFRQLPKEHYAVLQAYTNGVNNGIDNMSSEPYQYLLLGQPPQYWHMEDSLLCVFAMYFDLNDELGERERSLAIMKDQLSEQWFKFLTAKGGIWDAPMDAIALPEDETALVIPESKLPQNLTNRAANEAYQQAPLPGSNNWAIDASLTPYSSAMLANDMHLTLRVPNIWFRASWYLGEDRRVTGVTLPGMPVMVAGSNERIAWGYTNTYGDWGDIVTLKTNDNQTRYQTPEGWQDFKIYSHTLKRKHKEPQEHLTIETHWGPVIGKDHKGNLLAHQWIAYLPNAANLNHLRLEQAESVDQALAIAPTMGLPPQNLVVADHMGHIGWGIAGVIPERDTLAKDSKWSGALPAKNYPFLKDPDNHRIWTANNRVFSGDRLKTTGFEGGDLGARAQQIRDDLLAKEQFSEKDLLAIQLDARSKFLQRWQQVMLNSVSDSDDADHKTMTEVLKQNTELEAHPDSVAYGLVRSFRQIVVSQSIGWIFDAFEKNNPDRFKRSTVDRMIEYPVWELLSKKPQHLVPEGYESWDAFLLSAAQQAYNQLTNNGQVLLSQQTWGKLHQIDIRHPLSTALPGLGLILDMPRSPLSGDDNMPRVLGSDFGASMRMVVSPGKESQGIMHMPAGQSSHPFSPYYSRGHEDWVNGKPSAFLPGKTEWTLELNAVQSDISPKKKQNLFDML
jgi:penicillin amidase